MKILSHRGFWRTPAEKNSAVAFERSFSCGYGTETDVRDLVGELVISHDMPTTGALTALEFFEIYCKHNNSLELAINVKADGLQAPLAALIKQHDIRNYFLFDMAIPDALASLRLGLHCFTRQSEYEPEPAFYDQAVGVWIDGFHGEWWNPALIQRHLDNEKKVCLVSPDLHHRPHLPFWEELATWECASHPCLMICTDMPEDASLLFGSMAQKG